MQDASSWLKWRSTALFVAPLSSSYAPAPASRSGLALLLLLLSSSLYLFIVPVSCGWGERWPRLQGEELLEPCGLTTSSNTVWLVVSRCDGSRRAVAWSRSLLLVPGCTERVGAGWHKQGIQLAEPGTDGAGKWGTSPKHWNPLSDDPPHISLPFSSPFLSFLPQMRHFERRNYWEVAADAHTSPRTGKKKQKTKEQENKLLNMGNCSSSH